MFKTMKQPIADVNLGIYFKTPVDHTTTTRYAVVRQCSSLFWIIMFRQKYHAVNEQLQISLANIKDNFPGGGGWEWARWVKLGAWKKNRTSYIPTINIPTRSFPTRNIPTMKIRKILSTNRSETMASCLSCNKTCLPVCWKGPEPCETV